VGRSTRQVRDGLGRLIRVDEPDATGNLGTVTAPTQPTQYTYNVLDKPIQSNQGGQLRTFQYDALARLLSETTPEAGTVTYQYNDFNQVTLKRDARGVETHMEYDARNQLKRIFYTGPNGGALPSSVIATSEVNYTYSTTIPSRLIQVSDGLGAEGYSYDTLGRVTAMTRMLDNVGYVTQYIWNEANQVEETIYPSGRRVKTVRDPVGRLTGVKRTNASGGVITTYVSNVSYQVGTGLLSQVVLGNTTREEYTYDNLRFQLTQKQVMKGTGMFFSVSYGYQAAAGQAGPQAGNAGQIMFSSSVDVQQVVIQYAYDSLGRLKAEIPGVNISYYYDRWGNLTGVDGAGWHDYYVVQTDSQGIPTNRYASISLQNGLYYSQPVYDASGNMTDDSTYVYKYDAAGRLREVYLKAGNVLQEKFWYDHAGRRVKKEEHPPVGPAHWYYCLWSGEQLVVEYQTLVGATFTPGTQPEQAAGTDAPSDLRYQHWDIQSVRLVTDGNGNQVDTQSHYGYGEVMDSGGQARTFFTTYEREPTGLDYARARYYRSNHRRFTSPDRYRGSYRRGDPQSSNRYAYVANDPVNRIDPTGRFCVYVCRWVGDNRRCDWECHLEDNDVSPEPVDRKEPNLPGNCKLPSWDQLDPAIKNMLYNDERLWNEMSQAHQLTVLAIVAAMLANGLDFVNGFSSLQIVGIENGVVHFSGANALEDAFREAFINRSGDIWNSFLPSRGFSQLFHGFAFGARSRDRRNALHLTFEGNGILEVHIDPRGSGVKHFFGDGLFRGFDNPDPYEVWNSLLNDPKYKDVLRMLLDCPPPDDGSDRQ